jgi:hypothetical protein
MNIILGIIGITAGLLAIKYRERIQYVTGDVAFAEKYLGTGGTFTLYLLVGSATVILSILFMTGVLQGFISSAASPLF